MTHLFHAHLKFLWFANKSYQNKKQSMKQPMTIIMFMDLMIGPLQHQSQSEANGPK